MKKAWIVAAVALIAGGVFVAKSQSAPDPLDSILVCKDTQKVIVENMWVRVIDDQIPPGVTEPRHRHPHGVSVYLSDYSLDQITDDGKVVTQTRKANTANWNEPIIHQARNNGKTTSHSIRIELKF